MADGTTGAEGPGVDHPLIICGMHRSGTSFVASLVAGAGVHLGDELLEPSPGNPRGHFEDVGVVDFHRTVLVANGILSEGYTVQPRITMTSSLRRAAAAVVAARAGRTRPWGWKDPRTTLFLDFWRESLPNARFLLLFRRPWEVVDSLYRRGETTFRHHPEFALDVWLHYNRLLLDFATRHPHAAVVCELADVVANPRRVFEAVRTTLGVPLADPPDRFDESLLTRDDDPARAALLGAVSPEAIELHRQLQDAAGVPRPASPAACPAAALRGHLLADWQRAGVRRGGDAAPPRRAERGSRWRRIVGWRGPPRRAA
ncbi:MAG: sulfotransferase family protein [Planctomycetaceae bacterium]